jgi:hypothetical protein
MSCLLCKSGKQAEFHTEMLMHFAGRKNLDKTWSLGVAKSVGLLGLRLFALNSPCFRIGVTCRRYPRKLNKSRGCVDWTIVHSLASCMRGEVVQGWSSISNTSRNRSTMGATPIWSYSP